MEVAYSSLAYDRNEKASLYAKYAYRVQLSAGEAIAPLFAAAEFFTIFA